MYTHDRRVTYSEISVDGYADIAKIAEYFQDCSVFQSDILGVGFDYLAKEHLAWLLASWQIIVDRYPEYGEQIQVSTWPYDFNTAFGYRNFLLQDGRGQRLAVANSQWILVDTGTGHPVRITEKITRHYQIEEKANMLYAPRRIAYKEVQDRCPIITVPRALIDTNHHMNNAQYIRLALEYVPAGRQIRQVRVEYKKAAVMGTVIYPYIYNDGHMLKILMADENRQPYAVVEFIDEY